MNIANECAQFYWIGEIGFDFSLKSRSVDWKDKFKIRFRFRAEVNLLSNMVINDDRGWEFVSTVR